MQTSNNIRDTWLWRDHERGGSWLKKEKKGEGEDMRASQKHFCRVVSMWCMLVAY